MVSCCRGCEGYPVRRSSLHRSVKHTSARQPLPAAKFQAIAIRTTRCRSGRRWLPFRAVLAAMLVVLRPRWGHVFPMAKLFRRTLVGCTEPQHRRVVAWRGGCRRRGEAGSWLNVAALMRQPWTFAALGSSNSCSRKELPVACKERGGSICRPHPGFQFRWHIRLSGVRVQHGTPMLRFPRCLHSTSAGIRRRCPAQASAQQGQAWEHGQARRSAAPSRSVD